MKRSKAYRAAAEKIDPDTLYSPAEAIETAKSNAKANFDETVDVSLRLGVDPRKADQMVRGTVNLPNGPGRRRGCSCSRPVIGPRRLERPAPTRSVPTT